VHSAELLAVSQKWDAADTSFQKSVNFLIVPRPIIRIQLLCMWAHSFSDRNDWVNAEKYYRQAVVIGQTLESEDLTRALALGDLAAVFRKKGDLAKAQTYYQQAMDIQQKLAPESLAVAATLNRFGAIAYARDDFTAAENYYQEALRISEKLAPSGLTMADSLNYLGIAAFEQGDLDRAEDYHTRALRIIEKVDPDSGNLAVTFGNLGLIAWDQGDLTRAEQLEKQSLLLQEKLFPGSSNVAAVLTNLGGIAFDRGDLVKAEAYFHGDLKINEKLSPRGLDVARCLNNLGMVASQRGDMSRAEEYHQQAMVIRQKLAPGSLAVVSSLNNLGWVTFQLKDLDQAQNYLLQALSISEKLLPGRLKMARTLSVLGDIAREKNNLAQAEKYYLQALSIRQKLVPKSLPTARSLNQLGSLLWARGDIDRAEENDSQALAISEKLSPGSAAQAESLALLARDKRSKYQLDEAANLYARALNALEGQTARLGGGEQSRTGFRAEHDSYYKNYIDLLVTQKNSELAFQILEQSRARTLLETLTAAQVNFQTGVDPGLLNHELSLREDINAKSDRRIRLMGEKPSDQAVKSVEKEITDLLAQYQDIEGQIRATSPVYAALTQPQPLTAKEVQTQILDPNTLLLEYSLGEERSYVFAVTPDSLNAYELPKRAEIEKAARRVYTLLTARNHTVKDETPAQKQARLAKAQADYPNAAAELSKMILGPVASQLQNKRLLIVSDGALAYIPFSTLPEPADANGTISATAEPLVVNHEIVNLPSASVLAVLRQQELGRKPAPKAVAVMADPVFDRSDPRVAATGKMLTASAHAVRETRSGQISDKKKEATKNPSEASLLEAPSSAGLLTRSATDIGLSRNGQLSLPRLRFTRKEADEIMAVTPEGMGKKAVDFDATRAMATSPELSQYRIVHFATHGLLDSAHPELSGLVFSMVDKNGRPQNGFLELQDIYNLNLPADLVVLSACETGLGKEISGEGLVGLTRGFMYAGASRVVASLWRVSDVGTAELMGAFYTAMEKDGLPPAAALRAAQIKLWKQKRWNDPYYWAAFQIQGEWK
jgi:CHAT domain-containing protein/Tfp pilus assembly protein PilF